MKGTNAKGAGRQQGGTADVNQVRPTRFFLVTLGAILGVELFIMVVVLPMLPRMDKLAEGTVDSFLISFLASPILYFSLFRPLRAQLRVRSEIERKMTESNRSLVEVIGDLERTNHEKAILREMDDMLQSSRTFEEAFGIIRKTCPMLFPDTAGALLLLADSRNMSELALSWGGARAVCGPDLCTPEGCWALRRGQLHVVDSEGLGVPCGGEEGGEIRGNACAPMITQAEAIGVLSLRHDGSTLDPKTRELLITISRHIALALSNLQLHRTLHLQAVTDPLTGLFNRRYLQATMERELHRARRKSATIGVIMLDIDHFKRFNDDNGHEAGDIVLREIGKMMKNCTRKEDIVCRFGGEEFAIILPEATLDVCAARAESLRVHAEKLNVVLRGQSLQPVTLSAGVAAFPLHGEQLEDVLNAADAALYRSKSSGRNRVTRAVA
jgi:diguanylate cyclase (GGDEF)-like protein